MPLIDYVLRIDDMQFALDVATLTRYLLGYGHVAEWQTRPISNRLSCKVCGFESRHVHPPVAKELIVSGKTMKAIEEAIVRLEAEKAAFIGRIDGRIEGLREALRLQSGAPATPEVEVRKRVRRGNLKETVLDLAATVGEKGLTTEECVALALANNGLALVPASVSSLLSRLKHDGVMFYDGQRYRLKQFAGPRHAA